jgi:hypothetical protein
MPAVARSLLSTIALDLTCLQTFQAKSSSPHSASVGRAAVTTSISARSIEVGVAVLHEQAAEDLADVALADQRHAALVVLEDAQVLLLREELERGVVVAGREEDLDELLVSFSAKARSTVRLTTMTPPNALTGRRRRPARRPPGRCARRPRRTGCCA